MTNFHHSFYFNPHIAIAFIVTFGVFVVGMMVYQIFTSRRVNLWRVLAAMVLTCAVINPSFQREDRIPNKSNVIIAIDNSPSQTLENRKNTTKDAVQSLTQSIEDLKHYTITTVKSDASAKDETLLWENIENAVNDMPADQLAGVVVVSDGQVHDMPNTVSFDAPMHLLLTGEKDAFDRRITITGAPPYGVVGDVATVKFIVHTDGMRASNAPAMTTVTTTDETYTVNAVIGEEQTITLPLNTPGQNIVRLSIPDINGEVTAINNQTAAVINGVRDRLKVLLVTGRPYAGSRMWRDLLKSDPGIDLVHFTILREPDKISPVPQNELSLIAFPFRELFEVKLYNFDLIVFDNYKQNFVLPDRYFQNITRYVREGGGLFVVSGTDFSARGSLAKTSIGRILPALPDGRAYTKPFTPSLTPRGETHPVTAPIKPMQNTWGQWLAQAGTSVQNDENVLMRGTDNAPILVLNRQDKGRVAQLLSDHVYLWHNQYDGGGPASELLRRTVHWLMKQPELDEQALFVETQGMTITVKDYQNTQNITLIAPDGETRTVAMSLDDDQTMMQARVSVEQSGIYTITRDDGTKTFVQVGESNPREYQPAIAGAEPLMPIIGQTKGGVIWLNETGNPTIKAGSPNSIMHGRNWIGLNTPQSFQTENIRTFPILPVYAWLMILLGVMFGMWWCEGKTG